MARAVMADPGPWYKVARVVAVLAILGVAGGVYAWWNFFREVPQEYCEDVEPSRRAELCASPEEERFKYGSLGAEWELGIPYPIFHVLPRVFGDLLPAPGGYRAFGIPWEEGQGAAGRLLEEDRGVSADHPDLRDLPCGELSGEPGRRAGDRAVGAVAHHERDGIPRLPRGRSQRPALVGGRDAAGDDAVLRPRDRRQAHLPLPDHPAREGPGARAGAGLRLDARARAAGLGAGAGRAVQPDQVQPARAPGRRDGGQCGLPVDLERRDQGEHLAELGGGDAGSAGGLHRLGARDRGAGRDGGRRHGDSTASTCGRSSRRHIRSRSTRRWRPRGRWCGSGSALRVMRRVGRISGG